MSPPANRCSSIGSAERLTEFLSVISACSEETSALRCAIEWAVDALAAEAGAIVSDGRVLTSVGIPPDRVPVAAVAAISTQTFGSEAADQLAPRPLLLVHGLDDDQFSPALAQQIYDRAGEPKRLVLLGGGLLFFPLLHLARRHGDVSRAVDESFDAVT